MAKLLGVTTHTRRYYETENLIRPFTDPNNGYRYDSVADTRRFNLCRELRAAGFSLEQCFQFVTEQDIDRLIPMIDARKTEVDNQIYLLQNTQKFLDRLKDEYTHFSKRENQFYTLTLPERWYLPISRNEKVFADKELLSEYALKNSWSIYKVYCDDGYSGGNFNVVYHFFKCWTIEVSA